MTDPTESLPTPNEKLASLVATKLKDTKVIPDAKFAEVLAKLKSGTANAQDWRLWIDLAIQDETTGDDDGQN